jgi:hypothetical protein
MPVVLYECGTWSLTLREERRLRVFENRVLRRIIGPKGMKWRGITACYVDSFPFVYVDDVRTSLETHVSTDCHWDSLPTDITIQQNHFPIYVAGVSYCDDAFVEYRWIIFFHEFTSADTRLSSLRTVVVYRTSPPQALLWRYSVS